MDSCLFSVRLTEHDAPKLPSPDLVATQHAPNCAVIELANRNLQNYLLFGIIVVSDKGYFGKWTNRFEVLPAADRCSHSVTKGTAMAGCESDQGLRAMREKAGESTVVSC